MIFALDDLPFTFEVIVFPDDDRVFVVEAFTPCIISTNTTSPLAFTDNALPFGVEVDEDAFN